MIAYLFQGALLDPTDRANVLFDYCFPFRNEDDLVRMVVFQMVPERIGGLADDAAKFAQTGAFLEAVQHSPLGEEVVDFIVLTESGLVVEYFLAKVAKILRGKFLIPIVLILEGGRMHAFQMGAMPLITGELETARNAEPRFRYLLQKSSIVLEQIIMLAGLVVEELIFVGCEEVAERADPFSIAQIEVGFLRQF